ncbi:hypothetical protein [Fuchsiella alkaliacetigena]|uniref:hypothetical protein n=1 Tax=Fuchsiella alkaliacetigena TaxID=957042 RepID=UPI00200B2CEB|nr:hypothetical protein [Fuchsiella alkaliacetigena]MCK8825911.1 hypothetical protein [Fuchsiella alkaliacetigena]
MDKLSEDLWKLLKLDGVYLEHQTIFTANAMARQSIWRENKGYANFDLYTDNSEYKPGNKGHKLDYNKCSDYNNNFLTTYIGKIVDSVLNQDNDELIDEELLRFNTMRSQALTFNLFGEFVSQDNYKIKDEYQAIVNETFKNLFPELEINEITHIKFEYSPDRGEEKYTDDGTAFDVFVKFKNIDCENGFIGIEVKYSENMIDSDTYYKYHEKIYENIFGIMKAKKIFNKDISNSEDSNPKDLWEGNTQNKIEQTWRNHMLTMSLLASVQGARKDEKNYNYPEENSFKDGLFVILYPEKNEECQEVIEHYQSKLNKSKKTYFKAVIMEEFVKELEKVTLDNFIKDLESKSSNQKILGISRIGTSLFPQDKKWIKDFKNRYLNLSEIQKLDEQLKKIASKNYNQPDCKQALIFPTDCKQALIFSKSNNNWVAWCREDHRACILRKCRNYNT